MKGIVFSEIKNIIEIFLIIVLVAGLLNIFGVDISTITGLFHSIYNTIIDTSLW